MGYKYEVCSRCGDGKQSSIPATGKHTWGATTVTNEPTCGTEGSGYHTCSVCNTTEEVTIDPTGKHEWEEDGDIIPATCTEDGSMPVECAVCGAKETQVIPASHTFVMRYNNNKEDAKCQVCGKWASELSDHSLGSTGMEVINSISVTYIIVHTPNGDVKAYETY